MLLKFLPKHSSNDVLYKYRYNVNREYKPYHVDSLFATISAAISRCEEAEFSLRDTVSRGDYAQRP